MRPFLVFLLLIEIFCRGAAAQQKISMTITEYNRTKSDTETEDCGYVQGSQDFNATGMILTTTLTIFLSSFGFMGNGIVIWLLIFGIKRNHFTTYILNLSIADLGVVTGLLAINIYWLISRFSTLQYEDPMKTVFRTFFLVMYSTSQCVLTAISIDRCVSVFFPIWYRYHQPQHFSTVVCGLIWILILPFFPVHTCLFLISKYCRFWFSLFLLNAVLFTPGMTITTVAILIKVCLISPQHKRGKLLTAILLSLFFFLLFAFPMNIIQYMSLRVDFKQPYHFEYGYISASFNSTINPFIYFLVGRERRGHCRQRMRLILENIFKEDEASRETGTSSSNTMEMVP